MSKADAIDVHFAIPILDADTPINHLMMLATAQLVEHLEDRGLCAHSMPKWTILHATRTIEADIKALPAPEPCVEGAGDAHLRSVSCPKCSTAIEVF